LHRTKHFPDSNQLAIPVPKVTIKVQLHSEKSSGSGTVILMLLNDQESKYDRMAKKNLWRKRRMREFKITELPVTD